MKGLPESINSLIDQLSKMPGVGRKSAQRIAFFILRRSKEDVDKLAEAILKVKAKVTGHSWYKLACRTPRSRIKKA